MSQVLLAGLGVAILAAIHIASPLLEHLRGTPRSFWLSSAGGISVGYVFVHLLPELAASQSELHGALGLTFLSHHVYLLAVFGLVVFYGLDRLALISRPVREDGETLEAPPAAFWTHIGTVALYNLLIGYLLLHREETGVVPLAWFVLAIGSHLLVADFGLDDHHGRLFRKAGRWILAAALVVGYAIGNAVALPEAVTAMLLAFLSGAIILNVLKEEVPDERESRFWVFAGAAMIFGLLFAVT